MGSRIVEENILVTTREITVNGQTYKIRPLPPEKSIEILRLTVLHGLLKAPFKINVANIESLPIEVLGKVSGEIGVLTQQIAESLLEKAHGPRRKGVYA